MGSVKERIFTFTSCNFVSQLQSFWNLKPQSSWFAIADKVRQFLIWSYGQNRVTCFVSNEAHNFWCFSCSAFAPIGAYLFSAKVVGVLYDQQALIYSSQSSTPVAANTCLGSACFGSSLLLLAFLCALSALGILWFMRRTRRFYTHHYQSFPLKGQLQS